MHARRNVYIKHNNSFLEEGVMWLVQKKSGVRDKEHLFQGQLYQQLEVNKSLSLLASVQRLVSRHAGGDTRGEM